MWCQVRKMSTCLSLQLNLAFCDATRQSERAGVLRCLGRRRGERALVRVRELRHARDSGPRWTAHEAHGGSATWGRGRACSHQLERELSLAAAEGIHSLHADGVAALQQTSHADCAFGAVRLDSNPVLQEFEGLFVILSTRAPFVGVKRLPVRTQGLYRPSQVMDLA